jgi:hypothetical protein
LLWIVLSIVISTGAYFTIRYGLRPKAIPVMNATEFAEYQEVGAVVYRRLRQDVRNERVVLLGSSPGQEDVWKGFLKTALADGIKIDVLETFSDEMLRNGQLVQQIKAGLKPGHLVVVQGPTAQISHMIRDSLSRMLDETLQRPVLAISTLALTLKPEDQSALQTECVNAQKKANTRIECAKWRVGKILLKKKFDNGRIWAVMEQHGLKEFLIFIH